MYNEISYAFKKAFKEGRPALLSYTVGHQVLVFGMNLCITIKKMLSL